MTLTTYADVNAAWPKVMPAISREEAIRARNRLAKHYKMLPTLWLRRCWLSSQPTRNLNRGWARMIHDLSHRWHRRRYPNLKDHGGAHADFELEMVKYVCARGWLDGRLRSKPKVKPVKAAPTAEQRIEHVRAAMRRWETKRKRAETALATLRRRERGLLLAQARKGSAA
jgi:hypothetical protein